MRAEAPGLLRLHSAVRTCICGLPLEQRPNVAVDMLFVDAMGDVVHRLFVGCELLMIANEVLERLDHATDEEFELEVCQLFIVKAVDDGCSDRCVETGLVSLGCRDTRGSNTIDLWGGLGESRCASG